MHPLSLFPFFPLFAADVFVEFNSKGWAEPSMIYKWDEAGWKSFDKTGPLGRRGHGWVYNENRKETLLIGGVCTGRNIKDSVLFDVWSWNGNNWQLQNTVYPVKEPEVVYDPVNKRILVYRDASTDVK